MLMDMCSLQKSLLEFENALCIEYTENDVSRVLKNARQRLENNYQCEMSQPIYTLHAHNELVSENLNQFEHNVFECLKGLSTLVVITNYTKSPPFKLADVNYLGFTAETLNTALKYLTDKVCYEKRDTIIPALTAALNNVDMSQTKRLFIIMLMLESLGMPEAVSACAQLLYAGGWAL